MASTTQPEKKPLVGPEPRGRGLKTEPDAGEGTGHIQALGTEMEALPTARRGSSLLLLASMPRGMAQPRAMRETDEEDLDTFLMAGWKLAMIPRSERPRQTPEDSYTPRPQRKEEDASALSPTDERLGLEVGPSTTIDGELPRNMQVR